MNDEEKEPIEGTKSEPSTEEKTVPYERFKEVVDERNELRKISEKIDALDKKEEKSPTGLSAEEQKARDYLEKMTLEIVEKREKTQTEQTQKEEAQFEDEVKRQLELNPSVKKDEFLKFIEDKSDNYGVKSVSGAMRLYKDRNSASKEGAEKAKKDIASKPSMPSHEGGASTSYSDEDKGKSLNQIAEEVISKL